MKEMRLKGKISCKDHSEKRTGKRYWYEEGEMKTSQILKLQKGKEKEEGKGSRKKGKERKKEKKKKERSNGPLWKKKYS